MSFVMSTVVLVLSMLAVDYCHGQTPSSCDKLSKVDIPSIATLVANSPFVYDYTLTTLFECATKAFTYPARGTTSYDGTALSVQGTFVTAFDYNIGSDNKSIENTICNTGDKGIWYMSAAQFDAKGGFYCIYTCNGTQLQQFGCASNNNGASPIEKEQVDEARKVLNGNGIHNATENCPASKGCKVFH